MRFDRDKHHRHSIRLKDYDYSQSGAYFITVCTKGREYVLGEIIDGKMHLTICGKMVQQCWDDLPNHYEYVKLDAFVIMPNHVHGISVLNNSSGVGAGFKPAPTKNHYGIPEIICAFKTFSSRRINQLHDTIGIPFWQRNYYEHVIRNEQYLNDIRQYIESNTLCWAEDEENPINMKMNHAS